MRKTTFWKELISFIILLIAVLLLREYVINYLLEKDIDSYQYHTFVGIGANLILIVLSLFYIKKNRLLEIAGLKGKRVYRIKYLIFPLVYLTLLNGLFLDEIDTNQLYSNMILLILYVISIGFAEELSIRGFIQSWSIKFFGTTKKNVALSIIVSSLFFGILHLFKFDKGIYGELSQVFFATFIGVMFGVILVITKRLYPIIIVHAIIDFVAKLDSAGIPIEKTITDPMSIANSIIVVLLVLPCLIYGLLLIKNIS